MFILKFYTNADILKINRYSSLQAITHDVQSVGAFKAELEDTLKFQHPTFISSAYLGKEYMNRTGTQTTLPHTQTECQLQFIVYRN